MPPDLNTTGRYQWWKSIVMSLMLVIEGGLIVAGQQKVAFGIAIGAFAVLLAWIGSEADDC